MYLAASHYLKILLASNLYISNTLCRCGGIIVFHWRGIRQGSKQEICNTLTVCTSEKCTAQRRRRTKELRQPTPTVQTD